MGQGTHLELLVNDFWQTMQPIQASISSLWNERIKSMKNKDNVTIKWDNVSWHALYKLLIIILKEKRKWWFLSFWMPKAKEITSMLLFDRSDLFYPNPSQPRHPDHFWQWRELQFDPTGHNACLSWWAGPSQTVFGNQDRKSHRTLELFPFMCR